MMGFEVRESGMVAECAGALPCHTYHMLGCNYDTFITSYRGTKGSVFCVLILDTRDFLHI